jgi:hypothetical protein
MQLQHTAIMIYTCLRDILSTNMHLVIHIRATPSININFGLLHPSQKYNRFGLEHSYQGDSKMTKMPVSSLLCFFVPQPKPAWPLVHPPLSPRQAPYPSTPSLAEPRASPTIVEPATGSWLRAEPTPRSPPLRPDLTCARSPRPNLHRHDRILPACGACSQILAASPLLTEKRSGAYGRTEEGMNRWYVGVLGGEDEKCCIGVGAPAEEKMRGHARPRTLAALSSSRRAAACSVSEGKVGRDEHAGKERWKG